MRTRFGAAVTSVVLLAASFVSAVAFDASPAAADTFNASVPLACQTTGIPVVGTQTSSRDQLTSTVAPASAFVNDVFNISISAPPETESSDLGSGATLRNIHDLHLYVPFPANATVQGFSFSPGFGYGSGTVSLTQSGSKLDLYVQGPIPSNQQWKLPTINMTVK